MTTKCIDTLHTEHLKLVEFKYNSYSVTNYSIKPSLLHLQIAFPPQQYIVSNTYKLHKHSPLTSQYERRHTSQTQSNHSPVWQVTHITNTVYSLPSMNDKSGRSHLSHNIWNVHVWKEHQRQPLGLRAIVSCYMHETNWMKGAWGNCSGSWGQ